MDFTLRISGLPLRDVDGNVIEIAFIPDKNTYYWKRPDGAWEPRTETVTRMHLRAAGLAATKKKGQVVSEVESALITIHNQHVIAMALPLSGWTKGVIDSNGQIVLVTKGCEPTEAKDVPWDNLRRYLFELIGKEPLRHLFGWWKRARMSIFGDKTLPGQVPIFIGPAGAGKSMLQSLTTSLLGGRSASPFGYMAGRTDFNADLFVADHLVIEDQFFDKGKSRREFGARLKELAVNHVQTCHPKGRQKITLHPKWRCSMSMNSEREHLSVLPPLDESILDKLMLIRTAEIPPFLDALLQTADGWEKWNKIMEDELSGLAHYIDGYMIPADIVSARYGVTAFHDAELLKEEAESSTENLLLGCIRHDLPTVTSTPFWEGTANDLERTMCCPSMPSIRQTTKILSWNGALGTFLARLEKQHPAIFSRRRVKGKRVWRINLVELENGG